MENLDQLLSADIKSELDKVTKVNSPWVWGQIQTKLGYRTMEVIIIDRIIETGMVPAAIIPQLESENG